MNITTKQKDDIFTIVAKENGEEKIRVEAHTGVLADQLIEGGASTWEEAIEALNLAPGEPTEEEIQETARETAEIWEEAQQRAKRIAEDTIQEKEEEIDRLEEEIEDLERQIEDKEEEKEEAKRERDLAAEFLERQEADYIVETQQAGSTAHIFWGEHRDHRYKGEITKKEILEAEAKAEDEEEAKGNIWALIWDKAIKNHTDRPDTDWMDNQSTWDTAEELQVWAHEE